MYGVGEGREGGGEGNMWCSSRGVKKSVPKKNERKKVLNVLVRKGSVHFYFILYSL